MRIVHTLEHMRIAGNGITDAVVDLALSQAGAGHSVMVLASPGEYVEKLLAKGVVYEDVHTGRKPFGEWLKGVGRARRALNDFAPDIIHSHTPTSYVMVRLSSRLCPIVATAHTQFSLTTKLFRGADVLIAVSESDRRSLGRWFPADRLRTVRNGVIGTQRIALPAPSQDVLPSTPIKILYGGGLNRRKGVDVLLSAFAIMERDGTDATLAIAGDGPERENLERMAADLGLQKVCFLGFRRDLPDLMQIHDIFVVPSRSEPFGLVAAQARAVGTCIVASAVGGLTEVLEEGRAGVLVESENVRALAEVLALLSSSPALRASYASRAAENLDWLSVHRNSEEVEKIYEELVGGRADRTAFN